jgi:hypothetical protein
MLLQAYATSTRFREYSLTLGLAAIHAAIPTEALANFQRAVEGPGNQASKATSPIRPLTRKFFRVQRKRVWYIVHRIPTANPEEFPCTCTI